MAHRRRQLATLRSWGSPTSPSSTPLDETSVWVRLVVSQEPAQCVRPQDSVVLDQEHVLTGLDQLVDFIVDKCDAASARVDTELLARTGDIALDALPVSEFALLDQILGGEIQLGLAVHIDQQARPLTVPLEQLQTGEDFQQMLLAADGKNDCGCWQRK